MKSGTRLQSQVCDTQVIVVKAANDLTDLWCGGTAMITLDADVDPTATLDPRLAEGTVMGKRWFDAAGSEVLVTKPGAGTLTLGDVPLSVKDAKPLPASD
ncbi:hypothetical protein PT015_09990 [Candidatus Mycobacterium wuenschmannii]|uniref:Uncharacterized protein n=1 Tax=Candidatus Mycobacterium wuenschmannii TaxID=3027808 RepID=A0ABY8W3T3_9MYCO|nr:hypothetical protein [Candidatus Mycobacterium wuenschmannii]WIM89721.1 hypothetical protein PT015_09990 [Candidatus Mycobacterium wuenschmannii]